MYWVRSISICLNLSVYTLYVCLQVGEDSEIMRHRDVVDAGQCEVVNLPVVVWYTFMYKILQVQELQSSLTDSDWSALLSLSDGTKAVLP